MRNRVLILVFLSLIFLFPLFVVGESEPYDDDTWYPISPPLDPGGHAFIDVVWGDEGDLIYWHIKTIGGEIRFYLIDQQDRNDIGNRNWDGLAVFSTIIRTDFEYNITLPYKDTFYFFMENKGVNRITVDGWYARDETEPDGDMWGLKTNFADEVLIGSAANLSCSFYDRFDIVNLVLCENDVSVETYTGSADTMVEWTISDYKFTTLGSIEVAFKAEDQGRNIGIVSKTIKVVNKLSLPPTHSEPEYFDWVGIFEDYWYIMIPVGTLLGIGIMLGLEKAGKLH